MSVIVATASTTDVLNSVWGGVGVLVVVMIAVVGFLMKQINDTRNELRGDIGELRKDFGGQLGEISRSLTSLDTKFQVAQAREDERDRLIDVLGVPTGPGSSAWRRTQVERRAGERRSEPESAE